MVQYAWLKLTGQDYTSNSQLDETSFRHIILIKESGVKILSAPTRQQQLSIQADGRM
jgi:hypothetical protein